MFHVMFPEGTLLTEFLIKYKYEKASLRTKTNATTVNININMQRLKRGFSYDVQTCRRAQPKRNMEQEVRSKRRYCYKWERLSLHEVLLATLFSIAYKSEVANQAPNQDRAVLATNKPPAPPSYTL